MIVGVVPRKPHVNQPGGPSKYSSVDEDHVTSWLEQLTEDYSSSLSSQSQDNDVFLNIPNGNGSISGDDLELGAEAKHFCGGSTTNSLSPAVSFEDNSENGETPSLLPKEQRRQSDHGIGLAKEQKPNDNIHKEEFKRKDTGDTNGYKENEDEALNHLLISHEPTEERFETEHFKEKEPTKNKLPEEISEETVEKDNALDHLLLSREVENDNSALDDLLSSREKQRKLTGFNSFEDSLTSDSRDGDTSSLFNSMYVSAEEILFNLGFGPAISPCDCIPDRFFEQPSSAKGINECLQQSIYSDIISTSINRFTDPADISSLASGEYTAAKSRRILFSSTRDGIPSIHLSHDDEDRSQSSLTSQMRRLSTLEEVPEPRSNNSSFDKPTLKSTSHAHDRLSLRQSNNSSSDKSSVTIIELPPNKFKPISVCDGSTGYPSSFEDFPSNMSDAGSEKRSLFTKQKSHHVSSLENSDNDSGAQTDKAKTTNDINLENCENNIDKQENNENDNQTSELFKQILLRKTSEISNASDTSKFPNSSEKENIVDSTNAQRNNTPDTSDSLEKPDAESPVTDSDNYLIADQNKENSDRKVSESSDLSKTTSLPSLRGFFSRLKGSNSIEENIGEVKSNEAASSQHESDISRPSLRHEPFSSAFKMFSRKLKFKRKDPYLDSKYSLCLDELPQGMYVDISSTSSSFVEERPTKETKKIPVIPAQPLLKYSQDAPQFLSNLRLPDKRVESSPKLASTESSGYDDDPSIKCPFGKNCSMAHHLNQPAHEHKSSTGECQVCPGDQFNHDHFNYLVQQVSSVRAELHQYQQQQTARDNQMKDFFTNLVFDLKIRSDGEYFEKLQLEVAQLSLKLLEKDREIASLKEKLESSQ